jgi:hypothetical protein
MGGGRRGQWLAYARTISSREETPRFVAPMLARSDPLPPAAGWALEVKFDGMRVQVRRAGRDPCVQSRPGRDCTSAFPELEAIAGALGRRQYCSTASWYALAITADPTLPRCADGWGSPQLEQNTKPPSGRYAWSLPTSCTLAATPPASSRYERRRELLFELGLDDGDRWRTPRHFIEDRQELMTATREQGLEGVVAKRLDSRYLLGTRNGAWIKHKHRRPESFVVTSWAPPERRRPESLLLARVDRQGRAQPPGSVPFALAGLQDEARRELENRVLPPVRRGQRVRRFSSEVRALVAFHGPPRGGVRNPILRQVKPVDRAPRTTMGAQRAEHEPIADQCGWPLDRPGSIALKAALPSSDNKKTGATRWRPISIEYWTRTALAFRSEGTVPILRRRIDEEARTRLFAGGACRVASWLGLCRGSR